MIPPDSPSSSGEGRGGRDRRPSKNRSRSKPPPRGGERRSSGSESRDQGRSDRLEGASVRPLGESGRSSGGPPKRKQRSRRRDQRRSEPARRPDAGRHQRYATPRRSGRDRRELEGLFRQLQQGVSIDPHQPIVMETAPEIYTTRAMDLVSPIGKGQRCLIVSPPKAGKTTLLIDVARAVEQNHPEIAVYALLIDERPEEVTHFRRAIKAEVFAASSDLSAMEHVERADQAMTEVVGRVIKGEDVLLLLDSITRLARAYNNTLEGTGRTLTGGLDASTMQAPRQVFGAARKIETGGSLTILGTALIDTGSRMDEVIFQEFKGTGNTELVLSRDLFERRIFPCIDIAKSGSRKEEKLVKPELLGRLHLLRRVLAGKKPAEAMTGLLSLMSKFPTNEELLLSV